MGKKNILTGSVLAGILMVSLLVCAGCRQAAAPSNEELWAAAMTDAVFSEDDEIQELVVLTKEDPLVIWDDAGERVLLLTWHNYCLLYTSSIGRRQRYRLSYGSPD